MVHIFEARHYWSALLLQPKHFWVASKMEWYKLPLIDNLWDVPHGIHNSNIWMSSCKDASYFYSHANIQTHTFYSLSITVSCAGFTLPSIFKYVILLIVHHPLCLCSIFCSIFAGRLHCALHCSYLAECCPWWCWRVRHGPAVCAHARNQSRDPARAPQCQTCHSFSRWIWPGGPLRGAPRRNSTYESAARRTNRERAVYKPMQHITIWFSVLHT